MPIQIYLETLAKKQKISNPKKEKKNLTVVARGEIITGGPESLDQRFI